MRDLRYRVDEQRERVFWEIVMNQILPVRRRADRLAGLVGVLLAVCAAAVATLADRAVRPA